MLSTRESEGESHLAVELPVIIGTIPLRRSYGMVNKLIPATRLTRSYSGECKTFVTIKRGKMPCLPAFITTTHASHALSQDAVPEMDLVIFKDSIESSHKYHGSCH